MKKTIIAALMAGCMVLATGAMAQQNPQNRKMTVPRERPTVEQMAQRRTEQMTQKLDLNAEQAKKVYEVNLKEIQAMEAHRVQMKTERSQQAEQMKQILTTDQFVKWSQMQAGPRQMKRMKDGKPCPAGKEMRRDCSPRNARQGK